ncbi:MAG: hypothetical protein AAF206_11745 [Bacteroidota bacterium]
MRPKLKISNLTNLQDARSSAAVGFDLISFSLERGSMKKLSASMIWNMVNWLSGPEIVLEMNVVSLEELPETEKMFQHRYITLPIAEWSDLVWQHTEAVILRGDQFTDPLYIAQLVDEAEKKDKELKIEITLTELNQLDAYQDVFPHIFLHLTDFEQLLTLVKSDRSLPGGLSLGEEAEEEPGVLHYERIDDFMEALEARE